MKHFVDANGRSLGTFVNHPPPQGAVEVPAPPPGPPHLFVWTDNRWNETPEAYKAKRAAEAPSVDDQLQAIWSIIVAANLPAPPDAVDVLQRIKAGMAKHPKPERKP